MFAAPLPVDPERYALYLSVMLVMAFTPGPANLFAVATGVQAGGRAALRGVVGMNAATLIWFAAAAVGLGGLVAAFPQAFRAIALVGAAYVAWLGLKALWAATRPPTTALAAEAQAARAARALRDGFAVQIANPKVVLFFAAVLPPFLDPARPIAPQLAMLAAATITLDAIAMSAYGLAGGALSARMGQRRFHAAFNAAVGALLLIAAALIARPA